ncbi:MAG: MFS transporter [Dehalococcoidia bacterium]
MSEQPRQRPLATLKEPSFALYAGSRFTSGMAMTLLQATVAFQIFQITDSALQLGLIGLVRFLPSFSLSLFAGAVADRYDRRLVAMAATVVPLLCSLALGITTATGVVTVGLIYGLIALVAVAAAFEAPARQALLPALIRREMLAAGITMGSTVQSLSFVTGPTVAGLVIATLSIDAAYFVHTALCVGSLVTLGSLRINSSEFRRTAISVAGIKEGVAFVWQRQVLLGSMTLDLFAVIFGGASALLPIYALEILEVGPRGYGILAASLEAGALLMAIAMVLLPPIKKPGRALLFTVVAFALATIVFGLSRSFPLSIAAYMGVGMADQISVVMRQTTVQLATPDDLRGRVSSINMLFIGASNHLGAVESGFVAALTSATFAVVSGGVACLAVVGIVAAKMPELRRYEGEGPKTDKTEEPVEQLSPAAG